MEKITLTSFAKINLGLEVGPPREDGYHPLTTLFQTVALKDRLTFEPRPDGQISLAGNRSDVPWDENNLIYRSALELRRATGLEAGVSIFVEKNIPPGRGLAGGSSNAAVTLLALNRLWGCQLEREKLKAMAAELGADVPFFLHGGLCLGTGKGEELREVPELPPAWVVLVIPDFSVSTALAYREYDRLQGFLTSTGKESKIIQFLEHRNFSLFKHLRNDLELAAFKIQPQLVEIKKELVAAGAELSLLSGSGSAVFGWFQDWSLARQAAGRFDRDYQVWLVETVGRERYWQELSTGA
ncbi:MAG: 4-diphosphocytidyl-2-C-methyl-D-erythritol kinase [Candidatus Saccharicenans subterraneus]|uniref:4-diphosphocytidyl-2-C-methyl-D-erythritol kinase n=1 Tax=Candidatus Saccharicenans subterraneus TaxID=2508984 RepID=A0A3E2BQ68_9BACT|nr:MAG: 4-diphosphocytidyl-2-C-methyl-D-erythritol kinase [Candidatus Saccharicenans subterraneum]